MAEQREQALVAETVLHPEPGQPSNPAVARDDDLNRLSYWFPLIEAAGLPVPATRIVRVSAEDMRLLYPFVLDHEGDPAPWRRLVAAVTEAARQIGSMPIFLRTDYLSGKHSWSETCFVDDLDLLANHVYRLAEESEICDFMGVPWDVFVVREFLKTEPRFRAFTHMPITREFRYFVRDGVIEHRQPYWPPHAIEGHFYDDPEPPDWRATLAGMNRIAACEDGDLTRLTLQASAAVPGFWSVDWLETDRGWFLTDMAEGDKSFRWEPELCPASPLTGPASDRTAPNTNTTTEKAAAPPDIGSTPGETSDG